MLFNIISKLSKTLLQRVSFDFKTIFVTKYFFQRFRSDPMFNFVNSIHCCQRICLNKQFCFSLKTFLFKQALLGKVMTFLFGRVTVFFGRLLWIFFALSFFWKKFLTKIFEAENFLARLKWLLPNLFQLNDNPHRIGNLHRKERKASKWRMINYPWKSDKFTSNRKLLKYVQR